ncbi:hypothetical protein [Candidatus Methylacidithermus pantelleriae]|uniref:Uncharacterized protein n=1 Tax=Candidatus Methylacidithermus pantelleriae TaxID=2744239 RepID=A0A8J2BVU6_9BACT|nr:hypothetical protein [Candidatus Methylacidithermus pantelleriae]CAF0703284.1 hypothetical protein MPNT_540003 [Candidatus Methylacidithermus pantelleriae]
MIIKERNLKDQVQEILHYCFLTAQSRSSFYRSNRDWYYGGGDSCVVNRIKPIVDRMISIVYSTEGIRWWIDSPKSEEATFDNAVLESAIDVFNDEWDELGGRSAISEGIRDGFINGCGVFQWSSYKERCELFRIPTEMFGVYREDIEELDRQEAVALRSYISKHELIRWTKAIGIFNESVRRLIETLSSEWAPMGDEKGGVSVGDEKIIAGSPYPDWSFSRAASNVQQLAGKPYDSVPIPNAPDMLYNAIVKAPVIPIEILWVWDDVLSDYRVFHLLPNGVLIYDSFDKDLGGNPERPNPFVPGEIPFFILRPFEANSYFWGFSFVGYLAPVQRWYNTRLASFDKAFEKSLDPSLVIKSPREVTRQMADAFHHAQGFIQFTQPHEDAVPIYPQIPQTVIEGFKMVEQAFADMAMLAPVLMGEGERGARSSDQYYQMIRAASAPMKDIALRIETGLERGGQLLLHWLKAHSNRRIFTRAGNHAVFAQLSDNVKVKIDGHSHSPVFVEDSMQMGLLLYKLGIIDDETLVDYLRPKLYSLIKARQPEIQKKKEQAAILQMILGGRAKGRR